MFFCFFQKKWFFDFLPMSKNPLGGPFSAKRNEIFIRISFYLGKLAPKKKNQNFLWYGNSQCWSYFPSLFSFISSYFHSGKSFKKKKWKWKKPEVLEVKIRFLLLFHLLSSFFFLSPDAKNRTGEREGGYEEGNHSIKVHLKAPEHGSWIFFKKSQPGFPVKWFPHFHVNVLT